MAISIIPQTRDLTFTTVGALYQIHPDATILDIEDQLAAKQGHLNAMLGVFTFTSESSGPNLSDRDLLNYLWACRMAADEIAELTAELTQRLKTMLELSKTESVTA